MSKLLIGGLALLGIVVVGAGAYLITNKTSETPTNETSSGENMEMTGSSDFTGNITDLLSLGGNMQCTFSSMDTDVGSSVSGMFYIADNGNKVNGDFTVDPGEGDVMQGHVIRDGQYNYVWTSAMDTGFKFEISEESNSLFGDIAEEEATDTGINDNTQVDFDCDNWTVDNSMFVPPAGVEFSDFSSMMMQMNDLMMEENSEGADLAQCAACSQLPAGDARNQCLTALNCN